VRFFRSVVQRLFAVAIVAGLTAAALFLRSSSPSPEPSLDIRPVPASSRTTAAREVRVCVTAGPVESVRVKVSRGTVWREQGATRVLYSTSRDEESLVTVTKKSLRAGDRTFPVRRIEIVAWSMDR
jgi:hypothetical protein